MDGLGSGYLTYAQVVDSQEDTILSALEYLEFLFSLPSDDSSSGDREGSPEGGGECVFGSISDGECIQHSVMPFKPEESRPSLLVPFEMLDLVPPEKLQEAIAWERARQKHIEACLAESELGVPIV